jgi:hypothetical protein
MEIEFTRATPTACTAVTFARNHQSCSPKYATLALDKTRAINPVTPHFRFPAAS